MIIVDQMSNKQGNSLFPGDRFDIQSNEELIEFFPDSIIIVFCGISVPKQL